MIGWFVAGILVLAAAAIGFRLGRRDSTDRYEAAMRAAREELVQRINELFVGARATTFTSETFTSA